MLSYGQRNLGRSNPRISWQSFNRSSGERKEDVGWFDKFSAVEQAKLEEPRESCATSSKVKRRPVSLNTGKVYI